MGGEFLAVSPSDRAAEQAILALKKGAHLLKYGRRGKPKFCPFRLSTDEKFLLWYSGMEEKQLRLSSITNIIRGQKTRQLQPERECQSFSLIYANGQRSLDLICKDKAQADSWILGLQAVTSKSPYSRLLNSMKKRTGAQSCVSSPAGYTRRKHNLGLSEDISKYSQVRSLSGSPTQSFSERGFSDGLSCSSDSFYSESSILSTQNVVDNLNPNSPYIEPNDLRNTAAVCPGTKSETNILTQFIIPTHRSPHKNENVLRDVLIWGEGIEGGFLEGGVDKTSNSGIQLDALLPKLLESTMMLDVQKISLGGKHVALVTKQGEVFCWGEGRRGRLGHKVDMDITRPKFVDSLSGVYVNSVACGEYQTCALTHSGEVYTWGDDCCGTDLAGRNRSQWLPHRLSAPLDGVSISKVACGEWHTAIVSTSGKLFTYGDGTFGVLGHGNLQSVSQPKEVESLKGLCVKYVACGPWHTAAIVEIMVDRVKFDDPGGKLFTWGDGDKGRLGHDDLERKLLPTCVAQLVDYDFVQVSCGRMLTVALSIMGVVYTMGSTVHGQLGCPYARDKSITIVQGKLKDEFVTGISSGSYHIAALTLRGNVYTWGRGANGQLGLGDIEDRNTPTLVEALKGRRVEQITCGSNSTAAICLHISISFTDQSACRGCSMSFGFTRKKHNCYNCGHSFCRACSSKKATNASLAPNKSKPFRVCEPCFKKLQRISHPSRLSNPEMLTPRPPLITHKAYTVKKEDGGGTITTQSRMMSRNSCNEDGQCYESRILSNKEENRRPIDINFILSVGMERWGHVPCPVTFQRYHEEHTLAHESGLKDQLTSIPGVVKGFLPGLNSGTDASVIVENDLTESDKILTEEVRKLRAEAETLEKLCKVRGEKIQECQQRIEETWLLAKEEAANCKAAKEFIKVLTSKIRTMSEKISDGQAKNQVNVNLPQITSLRTDWPILKGLNPVIVATHEYPEVEGLEDRKVDRLCSSPILPFEALRTMHNRYICHDDTRSTEESCGRSTGSGQYGNKPLKLEWVEQYKPGVYITFITLPSGQTGLKRVRFSRKRFTEQEAERWWEENQQGVYQKYNIEGYMNLN